MASTVKKQNKNSLLSIYETEFKKWNDVLKVYQEGRFAKNYRAYTAYTDTVGTTTKISDPVAPEMVERIIQKLFESQPRFYVLARGKNIPREITEIISSVASYLWTNPKMIQTTGSMKQKLKLLGRELLVTGNACVESYFNALSDNPDLRIIPIEDLVFDPAKGIRRSDVYYVRQYVNLKYLENLVEVTKDGNIVSGRFDRQAVENIKRRYVDADGNEIKTQTATTDESSIDRSGTGSIKTTRDNILLVSRYEGTKVCRIVDWLDVLEERDDVLSIGTDPLDQVVDMEVVKEPYGFSFLDFINGLTTGKDVILNQIVDWGTKALNPPIFIDPNLGPVNRASVANAYKPGGVVLATLNQAQHQTMPSLPNVGFQLLDYFQQRSESTSSNGAYLGGVPNQTSDKTQGTAAGIATLTQSAQSPVKDRQVNIEESIIEPVINKWLKIAGSVMGDNEIKYILMTGQNRKWVRITKGLITGKIMLSDLVAAELIDDTGAQEMADIMVSQGKDPNSELIFDADWVIRVETNSMAEVDAAKDMEKVMSWSDYRMKYNIPTDYKKLSEYLAQTADIKNPEQYDLKPQDVGAMGSQAMPPQNPNMPTPPQMAMQPPQPVPTG